MPGVAGGRLGHLRVEGAWALTSGEPAFGGISGARLAGDRLWLVSDRSRLLALDWRAPAPGRSFRLALLDLEALAHADGAELDAEALELLPGDDRLVADEERGWVVYFPAGGGPPRGEPWKPPGFAARAGDNAGVEALARLPDGSLLAVGEGEEGGLDRHRAVRRTEEGDVALVYRSAPGFRPTDAAATGDHLFVLERGVSLVGGWRARIAAVPLDRLPDAPGATFAGGELAVLDGPRLGENHEALAVEARGDGYRLLVLSDDNFLAFQRTLLLVLTWSPADGAAAPGG